MPALNPQNMHSQWTQFDHVLPSASGAATQRVTSPPCEIGGGPLAELPRDLYRADQLRLFQDFLHNTPEERDRLSNTIDIWDLIPRYSISQKQMNVMRSPEGFLRLLERSFEIDGKVYKAVIQPARVRFQKQNYRDKNGNVVVGEIIEQDFYPSENEEFIEEALRKFACEQGQGFFDQHPDKSCGVFFTIHMLKKELARMGHARDHRQISLSLQILSGSVIEVSGCTVNSSFLGRSTYLRYYFAVTAQDLKADHNARCFVEFHPMVSRCVDELTYRQFNYRLMMQLESQLARWIFRLLAMQFISADKDKVWKMHYQTIKRDSGMLCGWSDKNERKSIKEVDLAFDELWKLEIIREPVAKVNDIGARNKVRDVAYTLKPSAKFVKEMIESNARLKDGKFKRFVGS